MDSRFRGNDENETNKTFYEFINYSYLYKKHFILHFGSHKETEPSQ